jgi:AbiTii
MRISFDYSPASAWGHIRYTHSCRSSNVRFRTLTLERPGMSLLRDFQDSCSAPEGDVTSILRKCKILAARLGSHEFEQWVEWELNGYPESKPTPEYRRLGSSCYANFLSIGWRANRQSVALSIIPKEYRDKFQRIEFRNGIAAATSFVGAGAIIDKPELGFLLQGKMFPEMNCVGAWIEISGSEFQQLVSAVKNRILDFVLKIEAENPDAGEAPLNSEPVSKERLLPLVNNFFGNVGNLAQNSQQFDQTAIIGAESQDLARLVTDFSEHLDELSLDEQQMRKAKAQIATLQAQISDEPDPLVVRQAGRTLRNITEGAIGSLLATAAQPTVWHWVRETMIRLF